MSRFDWEDIYLEFSNALLAYKNNRPALIEMLIQIFDEAGLQYPFTEQDRTNTNDVCPFSIFASFNKQIRDERRQITLAGFKRHMNLQSDIPTEFDAIPVMNNMSAWFYSYHDHLGEHDIDNLWDLFDIAMQYADNDSEELKQSFIDIFNTVATQRGIKWNITVGLFWIRPYHYLNLDSRNRNFLEHNVSPYYDVVRDLFDFRNPPSGEVYTELINALLNRFNNDDCDENNFIDLSYTAFTTPYHDAVPAVEPSRQKQYWVYAAGVNSDNWQEFYNDSLMAIGWDELGDLTQYSSKLAIKRKLQENGDTSNTYRNDKLALYQFCRDIQVGDVIYVKRGVNKLIGRGIVTSKYVFDDTRTEYKHVRAVEWTHDQEVDYPYGSKTAVKTLTNITSKTEKVQRIEALFNEELDDGVDTYDTYTSEDFLNEVYISESKYTNLVSLLRNKKNIIIQGPPGVGKTFSAKRLAYSILNERDYSRVKMIQFHQSYSYEDFIMGFRPTQDGFELKNGPFYDFCEKARNDDENDYFFIIDEINRGNLSKIFGELLMLIEVDKREESIQLMYRDEKFNVPKGVHIIGLMNTADRSLAMIDYALRRRFAFVDFEPSFDHENFQSFIQSKNSVILNQLMNTLIELNNKILEDENLGEGFMIGHSYLCQIASPDYETLKSIINHEIVPLLKEYWFDEKDKVTHWKKELLDSIDD